MGAVNYFHSPTNSRGTKGNALNACGSLSTSLIRCLHHTLEQVPPPPPFQPLVPAHPLARLTQLTQTTTKKKKKKTNKTKNENKQVATSRFILPCIENTLVDAREAVVASGLRCLAALAGLGLLPRHALPAQAKPAAPLLQHPGLGVRAGAVALIVRAAEALGPLDAQVFLHPVLRPHLRCVRGVWVAAGWAEAGRVVSKGPLASSSFVLFLGVVCLTLVFRRALPSVARFRCGVFFDVCMARRQEEGVSHGSTRVGLCYRWVGGWRSYTSFAVWIGLDRGELGRELNGTAVWSGGRVRCGADSQGSLLL